MRNSILPIMEPAEIISYNIVLPMSRASVAFTLDIKVFIICRQNVSSYLKTSTLSQVHEFVI